MVEKHAVFDGTIPQYYDTHLGPMFFEPYARDLAGRPEVKAGGSVLEVACGTGRVTRLLRERLPAGVHITATDLNDAMLDYARGRFTEAPALTWRQADAAALPFPDGSYDAVVCQFGYMFVPEKETAMREARRVLRPGGALYFNVWDRLEENDIARTSHETIASFFPENPPQFYSVPFGFHDAGRIRTMLEGAGFEGVRIETLSEESRSPSARDAALGLIRGNPVGTDIKERGTVPIETVIDAVERAIRERFGDPPRARMRAHVVTARA
ncbi:MAG TPA: class I SAM-dependent methyltransferase [Candidatus Eisenbacteria bacterium]|nr:class I SAM-dependent methyltransferase [Candidatus Eisenbacteria bacterium]